MTATLTTYLYPWDVEDDPAAAERVASLGVDSVTLAAAYHAVRAATPRHPRHRVVTVPAALHLPVREDVWAGRRLRPVQSRYSFVRAAELLGTAGLPVHAWVVLCHDDPPLQDGEFCVRNAFGDIYPYALCPSRQDVRDYARTLVSEIATHAVSLVVEACGPMGLAHKGMHDKIDAADWSSVDEALLSICCCSGCRTAMAEAGADVRRVVTAIRRHLGRGAASPEEALGRDAGGVLTARRRTLAAFTSTVAAAARASGVTRIAHHVTPDPWATGPAAPITDPTPDIDIWVAPAWEQDRAGAQRITELRRHGIPVEAIGAYVSALPPAHADSKQLAAHWRTLLDAGASELHLYHAGLASDSRLDAIRDAIAILREDQ